jgi:DNA (cytosine-5)-methyltransferase 1
MSETDTDQPFQVMPEFDPNEFERLKKGIEEHGIEYPIIEDADGNIIDGHHRMRAWEELGRDPADIPRRVVDEPDGENYHRAYRANLNRRDLDDGTKRKAVKAYLLEHQTRVREDSDADIALDLGVHRVTVQRARTELEDDGQFVQVNNLATEEKKREVREYVESNPKASDREVESAVDCDVSRSTIWNWRNGWDIDTAEQSSGLDTYVTNESQATEARDFADKVTSDDIPEDKQESVKERVDEVNSGEMSLAEANNKTEIDQETARLDGLDEREQKVSVDETDDSEQLKILNLYAGIGGNRRLWDNVDVTAVENDPDVAAIYRDNFPDDTVIETDAHEYLIDHLSEFDFIWSSPPCPTHSQMEAVNHAQHGARYPDMQLYQEVIVLRNRAEYHGFNYCVENVVSYYDPLIEPQKQGRHYYWSDVNIPAVETPTLRKRGSENRDSAPDVGSAFDYERHQKVLGFDLSSYGVSQSKKEKMLKNCVQPEQGKAILESVIDSADSSTGVVS